VTDDQAVARADELEDDRRDVRSEAEGAGPDEKQTGTSGPETAVEELDEEPGEESGEEPGKSGKGKKEGSFWKELPLLIGVAVVLALVIKAFVVQAFYIPSGSMENTLHVGDRVLVNKMVYHLRDIHRGDVVVFNGVDSWDEPTNFTEPTNPVSKVLNSIGSAFGVVPGEKDYIKRVIGVGGDHVKCCNARGQLMVNGIPLAETSYLYSDAQGGQNKPSDNAFETTVPQGRLWVMGDHRGVSEDSRAHQEINGGTIPVSAVVGRAELKIWPLSHWGTLPVPNTFKQTGLSALAGPGGVPTAAMVGALPVTLLRRRRKLRKLARRSQSASD
jgi:signal peptidase I